MIGLIGINTKNGRIRDRKINHYKLSPKRSLILRFCSAWLSLLLILLTVLGPFLAPITVYASGAGLIKSLIFSMVAMLGLSPSGSAYENGMNNAFGNTTIEQVAQMENPAQYIDNALNNIGVDVTSVTDALGTSADMASEFSSAASQAGVTLPDNFGAATPGQNIAAAAKYYTESQQPGQVAPTIGGSPLPAFDVTGLLINQWNHVNSHVNQDIQKLNKIIYNGLPTNTNVNMNNVPSGGMYAVFAGDSGSQYVFICDPGVYPVMVDSGSGAQWFGAYNTNNTTAYYTINGGRNSLNANSGGFAFNRNNRQRPDEGFIKFVSSDAMNNYFNNEYNDADPITKSPDLITPDGNARSSYNPSTNNYTVNYNPIINNDNRTTKYVTTIDWSDIEDWMQRARTNTEDDKTDEETQGEDYKVTIIREIVRDISQTNPENPDHDVTVPEYNPDFSTEDVIPVQPTEIPKPTLTPEEEEQNIDVTATAGLTEVFPFCIPWDIARLFGKFRMQREAPNFTFALNLGPAGTHNIHIDFSDFDNVAALLRLLELIGFILGLMLVARKLIGD